MSGSKVDYSLIRVKSLSVLAISWRAEVKVGALSVEKVKGVCAGPAVELSLDSLGMRVGRELLPRLLGDQEQCVLLGLLDLQLLSAERAHLFCGCVRIDEQRFGCATAVHLQGHVEIIL